MKYKETTKDGKITVKNVKISSCLDKNVDGSVYTKDAFENAVEDLKKYAGEKILGEVSHESKEQIFCKYNEVTSPMNYMGGKKKLLKILLSNFPDTENFVDLFCGGATVGINSKSENVWFNDSIKPLITMYKYMCKNPIEEILFYIDTTIQSWGLSRTNEEAYYAFRENYNTTPVEDRHPLDLFILMAYSFNNQIRFNEKKMKFNIPFGKNRSSFNSKMRENLIGFVEMLHCKNCHFTAVDYKDFDFSSLPSKNTFVYADPPYLVSTATYNSGWNENNEHELLKYFDNLDKLGYKFALSNVLENKGKKNTILEDWINKNNYNVLHIDKSYVHCYYQHTGKENNTDEVLITNYETPNFEV